MSGTVRHDGALATRVVATPCDGTIAYREFGAGDGSAVLALHGTPGSREKFALLDADARRLGLRIISPDRWGYGATPAPRHGSLAGFAEAYGGLMSSLGISRYVVLGVSGGGPFATAMAASQQPAIAALALVSPVAPLVDEWGPVDGIGGFHKLSFLVLPRMPGANRVIFSAFRGVLGLSPALALAVAQLRAPAADRAIAADPRNCRGQSDNYRAGLEGGVAGAVLDMQLFSRPWALDHAGIRVPSRLWLGSEDRNVPVAPAVALARQIPGCELELVTGAGHCWLACNQSVVLEWIRAAMR